MFGFSLASQLFQGSTQRTWNCVSNIANLLWTKFHHIRQDNMPRSRKRHHSRSRSRSRSHSQERNHDKHKKIDSHEKDGKRRKIDGFDSPHKRSVSSDNENVQSLEVRPVENIESSSIEDSQINVSKVNVTDSEDKLNSSLMSIDVEDNDKKEEDETTSVSDQKEESSQADVSETEQQRSSDDSREEDNVKSSTEKPENKTSPKKDLTTPKKQSSKQLTKKLESEKKRQEKQKQKEERQKRKQEEREEKLKQKQQKEAEKQKVLEDKKKSTEQKQKEREAKEEQKRKEREEKEQKRKEKEEKEELKRKERELEKLKRQQEVEEKNLEKQREEEKKQKTAAAFVNFFVPKKPAESVPKEKKNQIEKTQSYFMPFEIKSDMRLPPIRRQPLTEESKDYLVTSLEHPDETASYLKDLKSGFRVRSTFKTWPYQDPDEDITLIEEESNLGETICEDAIKPTKARAKFLHFHENRRPAYFGTWRKKSKSVTPRRPFAEDKDLFNYEEDSDDDWEEEEQGESLEMSDDEKDKEEEDKDDYEVDNDFFVPHGHLSDDEIDDEENARLSPESLKQKLKLLKDEFEEDIKSKTHKLKPRSIGCIWYNKDGSNVDEAIHKYLLPFAMITNGRIQVKKRSEISSNGNVVSSKKLKPLLEMPGEYVPVFLKIVHGNASNQKGIVEEFLTYMANNGYTIDMSKSDIVRNLKSMAEFKKFKENGKTKSCWLVNDDVKEKFNVNISPKKAE